MLFQSAVTISHAWLHGNNVTSQTSVQKIFPAHTRFLTGVQILDPLVN